MALLVKQASKRIANDLTMSAATATTGDTFANNGKVRLLVVNGSGAPINVTFLTPSNHLIDGQAVADRVISVGAGKHAWLGPFPKNAYNDSDGLVKATCSSVGSVTLAVLA
jgi:hypothetical protein